MTSKEPHISAKETYISAKETYISAKETYISAKEPWDHFGPKLVTMRWLRLVGSSKLEALLQSIVSFVGLFCKRDL